MKYELILDLLAEPAFHRIFDHCSDLHLSVYLNKCCKPVVLVLAALCRCWVVPRSDWFMLAAAEISRKNFEPNLRFEKLH